MIRTLLRASVAGWISAAAGALVLTLGAAHANAQAQAPSDPCRVSGAAGGTVIVTVSDPQGARIPGATVVVSCQGGDLTAVADADGRLTLQLPSGSHQVRVTMDGFAPVTRTVSAVAGVTEALDVALPVASLADTVTVRAAGTTVVSRSTTATRTDTPLIETPQSVSIITAAQIQEQASPNLQETLRYTAGVRNETYGIDNRGDWFSLRGSDGATVLMNGMRVPLTGWYGVVREEPFAYDQIAVLLGPSSIVAGQNEPGGVVNMVSKRPQDQTARQLEVRFGNYNRREVHVDTTGPMNANRSLLYRFVAVGKDTDTQIDHADEQRVLVAPSMTWRGHRGSLTWYGEYQRDRSKNTNAFLGRAGTLDEAPNGPIPTDLFIGEPDWDRYGGTRGRLGYESSLTISPAWQIRHSLRHDRVDGLMKAMYAAWWDGFVDEDGVPAADGRYLGRYWYVADDRARVTATEVLLEGRHRTGNVEHRLLVGADGLAHDASQASAEDLGTPLDVYAPVYGTFGEPDLGDTPLTDTEIRRAGFFAQDQMKLAERVSVRAGVRRDRVSNRVVGEDGTTDWATTGNVGVVYEVVPGVAPYVSYSQSFDPVAGTNAAGEIFKPKRGEQVEVGMKWESRSVPAQVTAAYYTLTEHNRLASDPVNFGESVQIGEAKVKGVELQAKADAASWTAMTSYTWTRARASAGSFGGDLDPAQQLEGIPEHQASVWAVHDLTHAGWTGVSLGGGVRYVGRIGDGTGDVFVPAVTLVDAMASYAIRNWRLSFNANNLTDKVYIATCLARGDCWFGQRRTISVTAGFTY